MNTILVWALMVIGPQYHGPLLVNTYRNPSDCTIQASYYTNQFVGSGKMYYCEHKVITR